MLERRTPRTQLHLELPLAVIDLYSCLPQSQTSTPASPLLRDPGVPKSAIIHRFHSRSDSMSRPSFVQACQCLVDTQIQNKPALFNLAIWVREVRFCRLRDSKHRTRTGMVELHPHEFPLGSPGEEQALAAARFWASMRP